MGSSQIRFRAWDGERLRKVNTIGWVDESVDFVTTPRYSGPAEDFRLMQYTGLKDKNGVEIYEGDIVSWTDEKDIWSIDFGEFGVPNFELEEYQDLAFGFYLKPQHDLKEVEPFNMTAPLNTTYMREITVIGNIYENPELLEREAE